MKKTYLAPQTQFVIVDVQPILAGSGDITRDVTVYDTDADDNLDVLTKDSKGAWELWGE